MAKKKKGGRARGKVKRVYAGIGVAAALVGAVMMVRYLRTGGGAEVVGNYYRGAADAAIVLEEFSDFR